MSTPVPRFRGVMSPVLTPFNQDLTPSPSRFVKHCRWLLKQEVGLAIFGTNSEANSLTVKEKLSLLEALLVAGLPAAKMVPGTGTCALPDTIELTRHAVEAGCAGVLMLPPFFYKGVSDEGLFRSFARVIDAVADERLRIYLYHIPPMSQVPITLPLIERLLKAFPGIIAGVKDSSGDWNNTAAMLKEFQPQGFDVFAGTETVLLKNMRGGGAGCITRHGQREPDGDHATLQDVAGGQCRRPAGGAEQNPRHLPEGPDHSGDEGGDRGKIRRQGVGQRAAAAGRAQRCGARTAHL